MTGYYFEREARTPYSESYVIEDDEGKPIGRVDVHYTSSGVAQATLCVEDGLSEDDLQDLIGELDDRLVMTAEPFREDFIVTVWRGQPGGVYSEEDIEDLDDEELGANGHNGHR